MQLAGGGNTIGGTASGAGNLISGNGIGISDAAPSGNLIAGNFIGTDAGGTAALGNTVDGIDISASGQTIGGTAPGAGNLISGNDGEGIQIASHPAGFDFISPAEDNVIQGNLIGTDVTGDVAIPNYDGVDVVGGYAGNTIGGSVYGAGNLISGNTNDGILLRGSNANTISGNRIGTDRTGTIALGNQSGGIQLEDATLMQRGVFGGVRVYGSDNNTIGGTTAAARNIISGNRGSGVEIGEASQNVVAGNWIGVDAAGAKALANAIFGVSIQGASAGEGGTGSASNSSSSSSGSGNTSGKSNIIGGTAAGSGNVISGNGSGGIYISGGTLDVVAGNWIGTDATGTVALANAGDGVELNQTSGNTIGGTVPQAANLISGNTNGVEINDSSQNFVQGNMIGTDTTGTLAIGNTGAGVLVDAGSASNTIGGPVGGGAT